MKDVSILRGALNLIDDKDFDRSFPRHEFQAKLFLKGGEDRCCGSIRRRSNRDIVQYKIISAFESGLIDHRTMADLIKVGEKIGG